MDKLENHFKEFRQYRGLTHEAIAYRTGCSRLAVIRNEQAVFTDPLPVLLEYFHHTFHVSTASLLKSYHDYQELRRFFSFDEDVLSSVWLQNTLTTEVPAVEYNPCQAWRAASEISKAKISTAFCIHPAIVSKIELKPHTITGDLPEQYLTALSVAGYYRPGLALLNEKFKEYVKNLNTNLSTKVVIHDTKSKGSK